MGYMCLSHIYVNGMRRGKTVGERDLELLEKLDQLGVEGDIAHRALALDAVLQRWRRRAVIKRELGVRAIQELNLAMELAELDALVAVWRPANEFGDEPDGETTVGSVASRLAIDPSRASRLTSELIRKGLVERGVSQQDARRAILKVSAQGEQIIQAVRTFKFLTLGHFLKSWTEEEIDTFLPLLERFSNWSEAPDDPKGRVATEIAALRESLTGIDLSRTSS